MINQAKNKIIIDTDPGHDDALAIMILAKSDTADIKAITTVAGNSTIENVTTNARYILDLIGSPSPIYSGASKPMTRDLIKAEVHGASGLDGAIITKQEPLNGVAVDKIIEIVRANPGEISILVIGPETNIAKAILADSELPKLVRQFVIMGGAIHCPGNKNRVAEFNIFVDPEAAEIVFNSGAKIVLIPLDICNDVVLKESDFELLSGTKLHEPIMAMMKKFIGGISKFENLNGALVYDALAAYYLINPQAYTLESKDIRIETKGEITRGMSVADSRTWGDKNPNIDLVVNIDKQKFVSDFISILRKE